MVTRERTAVGRLWKHCMSEDSKQNDACHGNEDGSPPTFRYADFPLILGVQIGPYKLLRVPGESGSGIVFLAEQDPRRRSPGT